MEVSPGHESSRTIDPNVVEEAESKIKQKLGSVRRRIKQIDLRGKIIDYPFAAVGIGLAAGALVALVRPMPQRGRVSAALTGAATALAFKLIRDAALARLGSYAKDYFFGEEVRGDSQRAPAGGTEYAPF